MSRDTIFISHATPDDNDFVRWLGTRLTGHGYKVWADLFELKGGTPFWSTIEEAIRHHACKVIFVVSRKSVDPSRTGVLNELSVADALKKLLKDDGFIIPVKIDDTPFSDFPIQIHRLNAIDFARGWGPKLIELLDTLDHASVPKTTGDLTLEFDKWRATLVRASTLVEIATEKVLTNLLPIDGLPKSISFYDYEGDNTKVAAALADTGIPHAMFNRHVVSFADMSTIQDRLPPSFHLKARAQAPLDKFLSGDLTDPAGPIREAARNMTTSLLKKHLERYLESRGLKRFEPSGGAAFYFPAGLVPGDKISYIAASGRKTYKNVVGRSEVNKVHWHLAMKVNVVLGPPAFVRLKPYVCFSENGQVALDDPKRTSAIRRRFCKNWWNEHWRQLQEAFCSFLSVRDELGTEIRLDGSETLTLSRRPLELLAARSMPNDLKVADEPDDPTEPDDEPDDLDEGDEADVEEAA